MSPGNFYEMFFFQNFFFFSKIFFHHGNFFRHPFFAHWRASARAFLALLFFRFQNSVRIHSKIIHVDFIFVHNGILLNKYNSPGLGKNLKSWKNPKTRVFFKIFGFFPGFFQVWVYSRYKLVTIIDLPPRPKSLLEMFLLYHFQMV